MDQLSTPYRIALVALLAVAALWFVALRPKGATEEPATTAPGVTGPANDVDAAQRTVDGVNGTTAPATATTPSTPSAGAPNPSEKKDEKLADDAAPGDPSKALLASVDAGKVAVVLFWNQRGSDDRATRRALRSVNTHRGKVVKRAVPIASVGKYEAITRGAQVLESPTVLVIGSGGRTRAITGFTQSREIDQAVSDLGGKGFEAKRAVAPKGFARVADDACRDFTFRYQQGIDPPRTVAELSTVLATAIGELTRTRTRVAATRATNAADRRLKTTLVAFIDDDIRLARRARTQLASGVPAGAAWTELLRSEAVAKRPMVAAAKKVHAAGCYA